MVCKTYSKGEAIIPLNVVLSCAIYWYCFLYAFVDR